MSNLSVFTTNTGSRKMYVGDLTVLELPRSGDHPCYAVGLEFLDEENRRATISRCFYLTHQETAAFEQYDDPEVAIGSIVGCRVMELVQDHITNNPEPFLELFGMRKKKADNQR